MTMHPSHPDPHATMPPVHRQTGALSSSQGSSPRRMLPQSAYLLSKDTGEGQRLEFQHRALFQALGNHYLAPLDAGLRTILDVGCGTGIWSVDMARLWPHALVVGIDPDPVLFHEVALFPPNCLLRVGDVLTGLPFPDRFFEYTHQRLLIYAIPALQWPAVVRELMRVTQVGGMVECVEADPVLCNQGPATQRLLSAVQAMQRERGFHPEPIRHLGTLFEQAGLQQVEAQIISLPLGEWGGRVGGLLKRDALGVFAALKERCCAPGKLDPQTYDVLLGQMGQEWEDHQTSCLCHVAYGKRTQP